MELSPAKSQSNRGTGKNAIGMAIVQLGSNQQTEI